MCPYLVYDDSAPGVCTMSGKALSPTKVSGYCEGSSYVDCTNYSSSDDYTDDIEFEFD